MKRFVERLDRTQSTLFPERLEDWIHDDNPVRVIDVFVDELDLGGLGFGRVEPRASLPIAATSTAKRSWRAMRPVSRSPFPSRSPHQGNLWHVPLSDGPRGADQMEDAERRRRGLVVFRIPDSSPAGFSAAHKAHGERPVVIK